MKSKGQKDRECRGEVSGVVPDLSESRGWPEACGVGDTPPDGIEYNRVERE